MYAPMYKDLRCLPHQRNYSVNPAKLRMPQSCNPLNLRPSPGIDGSVSSDVIDHGQPRACVAAWSPLKKVAIARW